MSALALSLVLVAAALHAWWNIVVKHVGGDDHFVLLTALAIVVLWAPLGIYAGWSAVPSWGWQPWLAVLASGVVHLLYFRCLLRGYRDSDLTVVYPVARGTGPLLASLGAVLLLGESISALGAAGVAAACGGVFLIAGGPSLWRGASEGRLVRVRAGLRWGALTGVLISGYTLIDGIAVKWLAVSPILIDYVGNALRVPFMLPAAVRDPAGLRERWRRDWRAVLLVAAISPLAYILVLYAMRIAPLSHVAPAREVSMLFAAIVGGKLLGESDRAARIAGAVCIALGVAALAVG